MKGFDQAAAPQQEQAAPSPGMDQPPAAPSMEEAQRKPASPELQKEYEKFVGMGLMALTSEEFMPKAAQILQGKMALPQAMAQIGVVIGTKIFKAARKQGKPVSPEVLVHGGAELMGKIGEMAQAAGEDVSEEDVETAFYLAADQMNNIMAEDGAFEEDYVVEGADEFRTQVGEDQINKVAQKMMAARKQPIRNR